MGNTRGEALVYGPKSDRSDRNGPEVRGTGSAGDSSRLSEELVLLLEKMLQRNRDDRFRTSTDLVIGLEEVVAQHWPSMNGDELLRVELSALFPEAGELKLTEHEVKTLFSAEERGEAVTDPRVVDDATEIFIPDTTRIDIYRKQIEALLEARRTGVTPVPGVEAVENVKEKRAGLGGLDSTWRAILVEGMVVLITLGILGFFALAAWIHR